MQTSRILSLFIALSGLSITGLSPALAQETQHIGNFGPTGVELRLEADQTLTVLAVQPGSPAEGKIRKDEVITTINGAPPLQRDAAVTEPFAHRKQLAAFITEAEATDGLLTFTVQDNAGQTREVELRIPVLGTYSENWPHDCEKTRRIIRAHADFIASVAGPDGKGLVDHNLYNGWAILMLLSTGEEQDLDVVRNIYQARMANFDRTDTGPHNWHNGLQGLAVCEYYLRTGDQSVMPLINAISESARKFEVQGGWNHWNPEINPQYVAGGLLNAAGTQVLTTMLLAKMSGAEVDQETLERSLRFFYRFVGHGSNPYGDHRPEDGYGSNNGKTEMLALTMAVAARAENGQVYAMARDKNALTSLYNYPNMLQGHTGGLGALWYGVAAALMMDQKPELFANRFKETQWFFELSRRHDGSLGASGAARYDETNFGYATGLSLTAPLKTLQITGAPRSPYAVPFTLPDRPWGREADLAFFSLKGGPAYQGSDDPPHIEMEKISEADEAELMSFASHPEHVYRERTADTIREKGLLDLTVRLLESDDPLAQHTACMVINRFEPFSMRLGIGTRSRRSLGPEQFSPRMFEGLMAIMTNPASALWNVDQALLALAAATPEQVKSRMDDILPWLEHEDWWLMESAFIALLPAILDHEALDRMLPPLIDSFGSSSHARPRGTMNFMMERVMGNAPQDIRDRIMNAYIEMYRKTPTVPNPEPGVDRSGIASHALYSLLVTIVGQADQDTLLKALDLSTERLADMRRREMELQVELLINAAAKLDEAGRQQVGELLYRDYRGLLIDNDDPARLRQQFAQGDRAVTLNRLVDIDRLAGRSEGWRVLGQTPTGEQQTWRTSHDPDDKPHVSLVNRFRDIELPERLAGWYEPDYSPAHHGWQLDEERFTDLTTPDWRRPSDRWFNEVLPEAGEVLLIRKTFELADLDDAVLRATVYSLQGFDVYLNGHRIITNRTHVRGFPARRHLVPEQARQHLRVGTNVIAVRSFIQYTPNKNGCLDVFIEALREWPAVD
jgi:hypothetical protein